MFAVLVLLVLSAAAAFGADENVAYFDNFVCKFNSEYCGQTSCILTPHNDKQDEQMATLACDLKKPLSDLHFHVTIFAKELQANLVDLEEDFCGFMSGKTSSKILAILMPFVKKHSNIDHPCPYTGKVSLKELPLGSHLLASHEIPSGDYILSTQVVSNGVFISNTTSQLHIPEGKMISGK